MAPRRNFSSPHATDSDHRAGALAANPHRRDAGEDSGGGAVTSEDATLDLGIDIELLAKLGSREIFVTGHSQGTQNAAIYPSFAMDERVVAVGLRGTVDDGRNTAKSASRSPAAPIFPVGIVYVIDRAVNERVSVSTWRTHSTG